VERGGNLDAALRTNSVDRYGQRFGHGATAALGPPDPRQRRV